MENVYLKDGSEVILHEKISTGYVIEKMCVYSGWEGEEVIEPSGVKEVVSCVLKQPPVKLYENEIMSAKTALESINDDVSNSRKENSDIQAEVRAAKKEYSDLLTTLERVPVLKNIERILNKDIVYFAYLTGWRDKYSIKKINDTYTDEGDSYDRGMKLLSLFGDSKGDLSFRLYRYRDGSGNYEEVIPCYSIDEAKELIKNHILKEMDKQIKDDKVNYFHGGKQEVDFMDGNGFSFPDEYRVKHNEYFEKNRLSQIKSLTETLESTKKSLNELEAEGDK